MSESRRTTGKILKVRGFFELTAKDFEVDAQTTALLIIDMQKYNSRPDIAVGKLMFQTDPEAAKYFFPRLSDVVIPNVQKLLAFFRDNRLRVCFVCNGPLTPDGSDLPSGRVSHHRKWAEAAGSDHLWCPGTLEHEVIDQLSPKQDEMVFNKNTKSAFNSTNIDQILRNMGIASLVIVGATTNTCVETTTRDASDRGYNCILVEDGCAALGQDSHDMTIRNIARHFGKVMHTAEVLDYLGTQLR